MLLRLDPEDVRQALGRGDEVWVRTGLSFVQAVPAAARLRTAIKRHSLAGLLTTAVWLGLTAHLPEAEPE